MVGGRAKEAASGRCDFVANRLVGVGGWSNGWDVAIAVAGRAATVMQQSDLHVQRWEWGVEWEFECACSVSGREWEWECAGSVEWESASGRCWGQSCACADSASERASQAALNTARANVNRTRFMSVKYSVALPLAVRQYYSSLCSITMTGNTSIGARICA